LIGCQLSDVYYVQMLPAYILSRTKHQSYCPRVVSFCMELCLRFILIRCLRALSERFNFHQNGALKSSDSYEERFKVISRARFTLVSPIPKCIECRQDNCKSNNSKRCSKLISWTRRKETLSGSTKNYISVTDSYRLTCWLVSPELVGL
jgi:hypothetical protein